MRFLNLKNLQNQKTQKKEALTFKNTIILLKGRQNVLAGCESKIFPIGKQTHGKGLKPKCF